MILYQNKNIGSVYYGDKRIKAAYAGNRLIYRTRNSQCVSGWMCIDNVVYKRAADSRVLTPAPVSGSVNRLGYHSTILPFIIYDNAVTSVDRDGTVTGRWSGQWDDAYIKILRKGRSLYIINTVNDSVEPSLIASNCSWISSSSLEYYVTDGVPYQIDVANRCSNQIILPDTGIDWFWIVINRAGNTRGLLASVNGVLVYYKNVHFETTHSPEYLLAWRDTSGVDFRKAAIAGGDDPLIWLLIGSELTGFSVNKSDNVDVFKSFQNCLGASYPYAIIDGQAYDLKHDHLVSNTENINNFTDISKGALRTADDRFFFAPNNIYLEEYFLPEVTE